MVAFPYLTVSGWLSDWFTFLKRWTSKFGGDSCPLIPLRLPIKIHSHMGLSFFGGDLCIALERASPLYFWRSL